MITFVSILLYLIAVFCGSVFGNCSTDTKDGLVFTRFWANATLVSFILAVMLHVFG